MKIRLVTVRSQVLLVSGTIVAEVSASGSLSAGPSVPQVVDVSTRFSNDPAIFDGASLVREPNVTMDDLQGRLAA
jgi:hypothetical protein